MVKAPLVSVIVPVYQGRATLPRAVDSLLAQSYPEIEIIIVDDGSHDVLDELVRERYVGASRVRYVRQEHQGPSAARNEGFRQARGEFIAFLDADDEWLPDKAAKQVAVLTEHPGISVVATYRIWVRSEAAGRELSRHARRPRQELEQIGFRQELWRNHICGASAMMRREVFARHGGYDEEIQVGEDRDLWLRMLAAGEKIVNLPEPLYVFYERPGSQRADLRKRWASHRRLLRKWDPALNPQAARLLSEWEYADVCRWWLLRTAARAARQRDAELLAELLTEVRQWRGRDWRCSVLCWLGRTLPRGLALAGRLGGLSRPT